VSDARKIGRSSVYRMLEESCIFVDIRRWHREGRLHAGQYFSCSWSCGGEPCGNLQVTVERDIVILMWRADARMLLEDVALSMRCPGSWEAANMRAVLGSHGYEV
jgi:hypothetical protein